MIGPTLRDRLVGIYANWLDQDEFGPHFIGADSPQQGNGVASVRQFLEELIRASSATNAFIERPAALEHPDSTFAQLLGSPLVTQLGPQGLIETIARQVLCLQLAPMLLRQALGFQDQTDKGVQMRARMLMESGCGDMDAFTRSLNNPAHHPSVADVLMIVLKSKLARRTIRSF